MQNHAWQALARSVLVLLMITAAPTFLVWAEAPQQRAELVLRLPNNEDIKLYDGSYALVMGVRKYTNGWKELPGTEEDVNAVSEALKTQGFEVELSLNPTSADFSRVVSAFIAKHGQAANNRLLIYFAGHGHTLTTVDGRELGYLVPADAPLPEKDVATFKQVAISMRRIEEYAEEIESKHVLFVFDSCFSGSLFDRIRSAPAVISSKAAQPIRLFITAGAANQTVPDKSIFREQFVKAVTGEADVNNDGYVTGSELAIFLEDKVTNYSRRAQTPLWGKIRNPNLDKGDFIFELPGRQTRGIRGLTDSVAERNAIFENFLLRMAKLSLKDSKGAGVKLRLIKIKGTLGKSGFVPGPEAVLEDANPSLHLGDFFQVEIENDSDVPAYFTIFDKTPDPKGRIEIIYDSKEAIPPGKSVRTDFMRVTPPDGDEVITVVGARKPIDFTMGGSRGSQVVNFVTAEDSAFLCLKELQFRVQK